MSRTDEKRSEVMQNPVPASARHQRKGRKKAGSSKF
jgi:hypothetical protein